MMDFAPSFLRHWRSGLAAGVLAGWVAVPEAAAADPGRAAFLACAACHDAAQPQRTGPDLRGVFGRTSGTAPGFRFSRAMKAARIVWDDAALDRFLADPQAAIPGNTMPFPGVPEAEQRARLIAYLKTLR